MNLAIVGVTGLVGREVLKVLEERNFEVEALIPVASDASLGAVISFRGRNYEITGLAQCLKKKPQLAIFSAGRQISKEWAPQLAEAGTTIIDNSSAWRMDPNCKLIVPEVNGQVLGRKDRIIANPNCSTIQLVMALAPLHEKYKIYRIVVSTYQSVTGTGKAALSQLQGERNGEIVEKVYPYQIDLNAIPHIDDFLDNGYTKEEMKIINETQKIMDDTSIRITATAVRLPVIGGHSESVNIEFRKEFNLDEIRETLQKCPGVKVEDDFNELVYPMPINAHGKDAVFVGRIRRDFSKKNAINMWIVADNLRKGAATNAVQIAEHIIKQGFVNK